MNWGLTPTIAYDGTRTPLKTTLFIVMCLAWVLPGLVGHDPWKYDEAVVFGAVTEMLRNRDWLAFSIAGEPYFDRAPLFFWVAAAFAKVLGIVLPLHDAARLVVAFFMAATIALLSAASYELEGARGVRLSVLLFLGCLGLLLRAHEMTTDLAGLAGVALGLYGLALAARRPWLGGALAGAGIGAAFLGDGFLPAGTLAALMVALPAASALWRTRAYAGTFAIAMVVAAPLIAAWPLALTTVSPVALRAWMAGATASRWADGVTQGWVADLLYFARILPWYAWPAWPLAAWALWKGHRNLAARRDLMLPLAAFAAFFLALSLFGDARDVNALPLLLPLALLGAAEIDSLPRGAASALDWFGMTTFFLLGVVLWVCWVASVTGSPELAAQWIAREVPGYRHKFSFLAVALAALLTLIWLVVVARSLRSPRRALVNWAAGITMAWMLMMTLGLPLVDRARSYREVSGRIVTELPPNFRCIVRRNVGDAQRALLDYFANIRAIRDDHPGASSCKALLVQAAPLHILQIGPEWEEHWRGSRPGDRNELFILYWRKQSE